jgi:hypothetical protein
MAVVYDIFGDAFLAKISEYDFLSLFDDIRTEMIDGYLKRAVANFKKNCLYDFSSTANDEDRQFDVEVKDEDIDELVDIISDGMVVQWMKPFVYKQELLQNQINTRDFTTYSPAELLLRVGNAYKQAQKDYIQAIREYSYNHGNLEELHA